jgi:DNA-binding NtrC family response regulator/tetratricopeptide (TPR) repeat protein
MVELAELLGESPGIRAVREQVRRLVQHAVSGRRQPPVLIRGETGTGKGLLAQAIHHASPRARGPFVPVNCAAIPGTLLEAELFGVEAGAFTDARQRKPGLFQTAHRGTLFLDEIGALARELQAKLLTAIEDRVVRRVGGTRSEAIDVWVISATSADLEAAMTAKGFRPDLYHRLATISLWLPPLRERGGDVLQLAGEFLARACADYGCAPKRLAPEAQAAIAQYRWPGNVRELANVMERVALMTETAVVAPVDLGLPGSQERPAPDHGDTPAVTSALTDSLHVFERAQLIAALEATGWNVVHAAQHLGLPRTTLRYRMAKYRLAQSGEPLPSPAGRRGPAEAAEQRPAPSPAAAREERTVTLLWARFERITAGAMEVLIEKVDGFGGQLVEVDSSGFLAAFGATPVEDAPARAARAALAVRTALARAARDGASWPTGSASVVIALHMARVLTERPAGASSPPRMISLSPDDPCRAVLEDLLAIAEQESIRVSPTTVPFLERRFTLAPLGSANRRAGRVLIGLEPSGLGLAGRPLSHLVGRQDELGMLRALLDRADREEGQVVGLIGEPGVGKSRLVYEFRESLARPPVTYLEGHCLSSGTTTPYVPVLELLRQALGTSELDSSTEITDKVRQHLESLGIESETSLPYVLDLLGVPTVREQLDKLTPELVKRQTFETVRRICLRLSRQHPVVLVVEDLHWIDATSREFLASLIDPIASARVLLLTTGRPGSDLPGLARSHGSQIAMARLSPRDSFAIVRGIATEDRVPAALADAIVQKGAGNPFLLEELTWNVATDDGAAAASVPDTIGEVLRARIDRLPPHDRGLLQAAAVIGKDVPFALLRSIAELSDHELRQGLARLQAAEFLHEAHLSPDLAYTFKHALTQEVTYGGLLQERRRALHARIVDAIETLHRERLGEQIERLAHHALRGEVREKAVPYLRQAGGKAAARSALPEARGWFEQALGVLEALPESASTLEQGFEIRLELRSALVVLGDVRQALKRLREAEALAEKLNDDRRRGRVCAFMTNTHSMLGELDEALASGTRTLAIAWSLGDLELRILATSALEQAHYYRGEYERVVELATDNLAALPADRIYEYFGRPAPTSVYDRLWLVQSLAQLGRFAEATPYEAEAPRLAEPTHHAFTIAQPHRAAGTLGLLKGDWAKARPLIERWIAVARTGNVSLLLPNAVVSSAWLLAQLGEASEALNRLREGEEILERSAASGFGHLGWDYHALGRACLLLGRLDESRTLGDRALESSKRFPGFAAHALHLLGDIATHPDRFDAESGEVPYRQALALAEPRGMRPLVAQCHLGLGTLYRRTGDRQQAQEHLTIATAMFREMDMRFWLEQAETRSRTLA